MATDTTPAEDVLVEASEQLREGLAELRDLAHGIHPAVLGEHGLGAAMDGLVARCPFPVDVRGSTCTRVSTRPGSTTAPSASSTGHPSGTSSKSTTPMTRWPRM